MKYLSVKEVKALQAITDLELDAVKKIEIKEEFFDEIILVRPKSLLLKKGDKYCWVGRTVIVRANNLKDENPNDPKSIEVYSWVTLNWQPIKKDKKQ